MPTGVNCQSFGVKSVKDVEQAIPKYDARIDHDVSIKHLAKPWQSKRS